MPLNRRGAATALTAYDKALAEELFSGSRHPDDWDAIRERYLKARQRLLDHMTGETRR